MRYENSTSRTAPIVLLFAAALGVWMTSAGCVQRMKVGERADTEGGTDVVETETSTEAGPDAGPDAQTADGETTDGCTPKRCGSQMCGTVSDGCGGTLDCGGCTGDLECGVGDDPNRCAPVDAHCDNGTKDGNESATDCGGRCAACGSGSSCNADGDCKSGDCQTGTCKPPLAWETRAPMPTPRTYLTAEVANDGRLYAIGGRNKRNNGLDNVEVYDPEHNAWTTVTPLPTPRYGHASVATGEGTIWVIGGVRVTGGESETTTSVLTYDVASDSWTEGPPLNRRRRYASAAITDDGRLFVVGGMDSDTSTDENENTEVYDPENETWTLQDLELNKPRNNHGVALAGDGNLYAVGGTTPQGITNSMEFHEPGASGWFTVDAYMKHPREFLGLVATPDGRLWAVGGFGGRQRQEMALVEIFDPSTGDWTEGPSLDIPRWTHGTAVDDQGRIYVVGGEPEDGTGISSWSDSLEVLAP